MKDNWLKDIHDRMADYETDEPRGLWEDICSATPSPTPSLRRKEWGWISSAVAASILLCWYVANDRPNDVASTTSSSPTAAQVAADEHTTAGAHANTDTNAEIAQNVVKNIKSRDNQPIAALTNTNQKNNDAPEALADKELAAIPDTPSHQLDNTTSETSQTSQSSQTSPTSQVNSCTAPYTRPATERRSTPQRRFLLALAHSGGANADNRQTYHTGYLGESATLNDDDTRWMDSPLLGFMDLNRGAETERRVKHHAPIRTGLSVAYRLSDRWSLESGLTYVTLASESQEGSSANYLQQHQRLHYVGIPLGASFRVVSWKRLDLYLSAHALAEQCVKGRQDEKFVIADEVLTETVETVEEHPLQWSVGVKAGVQYNVTPAFSLYAEPACNYYFDDGSSLETIYKEHPTQVSLNVGLRFSLGRK